MHPSTGVPKAPLMPETRPSPWYRYFFSAEFWISCALVSAGGGVLFFLLLYGFLPLLTRQGAQVRVPKVQALTYSAAEDRLSSFGLSAAVLDSQYVHELPRGSVIKQVPEGGSTVKPGRTVYLIINKTQPPDTKLPDIRDVNLQQARYMLGNWGLNVGEIEYVAGDATDLVVGVRVRGREVPTGSVLKQGTRVDLTVSRGGSGAPVEVPNLNGRTLDEATALLNAANLSVGRVEYGRSPVRQPNGTVYDQKPTPEGGTVSEGSSVDLFIAGSAPNLVEGGR